MASSSSYAPPPTKIQTFIHTNNGASLSAPPPPAEIKFPTLQSINNEADSSSSSELQQSKILILKSSDEDEFQVEESIAIQSGTIKHMVEDGYTVIPLLNVDSKVLIKILDYMINHRGEKTEANEEQMKEFDKEFVKMSFKKLFSLVFAANYLHIPGLMNLLCQNIADRIKNKSVNAVRHIFGIANDYAPEEEAEVRREHEWAHEGEFDDTVDDYDDDDDTSEEEGEDEDEEKEEEEEESDDDSNE
ncbi:unnamed protein product [Withania somnifera]